MNAGEKLDINGLERYWKEFHQELCAQKQGDALLVEANPWLVSQFDHFGHLLGVRQNLQVLGELQGRRLLDLGCGRGRWCRFFAERRAQITGVDWSEGAIEHARKAVPKAEFFHMPITALEFASASFEVVNSVTVIQHLPPEAQLRVFSEAYRVLQPGGLFSCIELTAPQPGGHVFPRTAQGWVDLAGSAGFKMIQGRGCSYDLLMSPYKRVVQFLHRPLAASGENGLPTGRPGHDFLQRANRLVMASVALLNFPLEPVSHILPTSWGTHVALVFCKE